MACMICISLTRPGLESPFEHGSNQDFAARGAGPYHRLARVSSPPGRMGQGNDQSRRCRPFPMDWTIVRLVGDRRTCGNLLVVALALRSGARKCPTGQWAGGSLGCDAPGPGPSPGPPGFYSACL